MPFLVSPFTVSLQRIYDVIINRFVLFINYVLMISSDDGYESNNVDTNSRRQKGMSYDVILNQPCLIYGHYISY